jgi:hypothetical protein
LYLISAQAGDQVGGIDIALVPGIAALQARSVQEWMDAQGYGLDAPEECMYLSEEQPPGGYPCLRLRVTAAEYTAWQQVSDEQDDQTAADRDGQDRTGCLADLRLYRQVTEDRDRIVRAAYAAIPNINRIHRESGISRPTIYKILGDSGRLAGAGRHRPAPVPGSSRRSG